MARGHALDLGVSDLDKRRPEGRVGTGRRALIQALLR